MTVVIEPTQPPDDSATGTAFAAGVAAATASQAAEEATEAVQEAEAATETAESALEVASQASGTAWDARTAVDDLRFDIMARLDRIEERLPAEGSGGPPAPEKIEKAEPETKAEAEGEPETKAEPEEKAYGHRGWFGG